MAAINIIERIVSREKINCNFKRVNGYLFLSFNDKHESIEKEYRATIDAGLKTKMLPQLPGIYAPGDESCIMFPDQAQFNPMKYISGLANAVIANGGQIFTETRAEEITRDGARTNGHRITAKNIVVATNTPVNDMVTMHTKQYPYRTYVIAASIPKGSLPYALWWDTGDQESKWESKPYHYIRIEDLDDRHDLVIVGGEDHRVGQADSEDIGPGERYELLYNWARQRGLPINKILYKWSGQIMEPIDSLAFIGKNPGDDNIFIITGDSGNGMTHGTIGGMLITDLINGKDNPWEDLYDPSRISVKAAGEFLKEAGNMASQYTGWIKKGEVDSTYDLGRGEGGILSSGLKKYAVYRDNNGTLHTCTAVCPHLGGILTWNDDEKSFDCPVHGSRFTGEGIVINGPAISDLKHEEIKEEVRKRG